MLVYVRYLMPDHFGRCFAYLQGRFGKVAIAVVCAGRAAAQFPAFAVVVKHYPVHQPAPHGDAVHADELLVPGCQCAAFVFPGLHSAVVGCGQLDDALLHRMVVVGGHTVKPGMHQYYSFSILLRILIAAAKAQRLFGVVVHGCAVAGQQPAAVVHVLYHRVDSAPCFLLTVFPVLQPGVFIGRHGFDMPVHPQPRMLAEDHRRVVRLGCRTVGQQQQRYTYHLAHYYNKNRDLHHGETVMPAPANTYLCSMRLCAYLLLMMILLSACGNDGITEDSNGDRTFTYAPLQWTMQLPKGWQVLTEAERDRLNYAAENYYEEAGGRHKGGEKKIIMGVRKGESNMNACYIFTRSYARDEDYPSLRDLLRQQKQQYTGGQYTLWDTLVQERMGSADWEKAVLRVSYNNKPYFTYTTYSTMIDTLNFGCSIVTNNSTDEKMLDYNFRQAASATR